jgi:uncharacterized protein YkwD
MDGNRIQIRLAIVAASLAAVFSLSLARPEAAPARSACQAAYAQPGGAGGRTMTRATLCLLNGQRARRGLSKLRLSSRLSRAAQRHAQDMTRRNYFSHYSPAGGTFLDRIRRTGYLRNAQSWVVGENLAWGSGSRATPGSIVQAWMRSSGHRANILTRRFRHIGIGIAFGAPANVGGRPAATYATEFGAKR